jgi:hypothetical protein
MAQGRGGYQRPSKPASVSGPGKFSKRTDGQPQVVPNVGESPDLQYGDRKAAIDRQRVAPLKGAQGASVGPVTGQASSGQAIPPWLIDMDSSRPSEPGTTGLPFGGGAGPEVLSSPTPAPDVREQVLTYLWTNFGNEDAMRMLSQMRDERSATAQRQTGGPFGPGLGSDVPQPTADGNQTG